MPASSIATVYRTVRLLEEKGILERRDFGGGRARYEPTEHGHHYHLIDVDTGKVIEFQDPEHERLMHDDRRAARASTSFRCGSSCSAGAATRSRWARERRRGERLSRRHRRRRQPHESVDPAMEQEAAAR